MKLNMSQMHLETLEIAFLKVFVSKFPGEEYHRTR